MATAAEPSGKAPADLPTPSADPAAVVAALQWRYAVKAFDPAKPVPPEKWQALEAALVLAPSSYGLQAWKFFVLTDPATRERLLPAAWNQRQLVDGSHVVVFCTPVQIDHDTVARHIDRTAEQRGVPRGQLAGFENMVRSGVDKPLPEVQEWAAKQVYLALGTFLTTAAVLGVDCCPMEGFDARQVEQILGLDEAGYTARVLAAVGHRAADDKLARQAKTRLPAAEVVAPLTAPPAADG